ncbi:MAG: PAS domain-containing protein [Deltaproteobacteria bacterium]|nr:PAS domain-containing protein [Deltaproteobacteria bacterium]
MEDIGLLARSALNALSANMAILDDEGFILCTNQSWNVFAQSNGSIETSFEGANYLEVCDCAQGDWSEEASIAATGIREVISGIREGFELEYPCHSPDQERWFSMRVTRYRDYERVLVVVSHENIIEWKRVEAALGSQNARLRAVLDNMLAGVTFFEGEVFRPVLANRMGEELLGRSLPPAMASNERESYFQAYRAGTDEPYPIHRLPFVRAMSGESCSADDMEIRLADGSRVRLEVFGAPVRDTSGWITGAVAIFHDITMRKRMEEVLQESEDRFRRAMEATNDGIWDWNVTNGNVYYSPGYFRMLGYESGEFPAKADTWLELIHPDDRERAWAANDACIRNESPAVNVEFRMRSRDGSWRWILGRGVATRRDKDGQALQMIGTHMDISNSRSTYEVA